MVTDVELAELRYSGRPAAFLRGFRAAYLGLVVNILIMGWVNLGMAKILEGMLGIDKWQAIIVCLLVTFAYTVINGFWGVAATDAMQYVFEMGGAILLSVLALDAVGGMDAVKAKLAAAHPAGTPPGTTFGSADAVLSFWPAEAAWTVPVITMAALLLFNWWASWYPGAEPGGGGYVAQNMLACRTERDSRNAVLLFNIAHYAMRPWPWVITALCALALYGGPVTNSTGAPTPASATCRIMVDILPPGVRGLMLASFAAAYMSTVATQMNWGASYLTNDLYRRFVNKDASERHYVMASRVSVVITVLLSLIATYYMEQVSKAWELLMMLGAGTGLVYILRWYWWRINAWSEVAAMAAAFVVSMALRLPGTHHAGVRHRAPRGLRRRPHHHHDRDHDRVAGGDVPHRARARGRAPHVLPARAPGGSGLGAARPRHRRRRREGRDRPQPLVLAPRRRVRLLDHVRHRRADLRPGPAARGLWRRAGGLRRAALLRPVPRARAHALTAA